MDEIAIDTNISWPLYTDMTYKDVFPETVKKSIHQKYSILRVLGKIDLALELYKVTRIAIEPELLAAFCEEALIKYTSDNDELGFESIKLIMSETAFKSTIKEETILAAVINCFSSRERIHKIDLVSKLTGFKWDETWIESNFLENKIYNNPLYLEVPYSLIEKHFLQKENQTMNEYKRIYNIFGCHKHYQKIITILEKVDGALSLEQKIDLTAFMIVRDGPGVDSSKNLRETLFKYISEENHSINEAVEKAFSYLINSDDKDLQAVLKKIVQDFSNRIRKRNPEVVEPILLEQVALNAYKRSKNSIQLTEILKISYHHNLSQEQKQSIVRCVIDSRFFPRSFKAFADKLYEKNKIEEIISNAKYYIDTLAIPNKGVKEIACSIFNDFFENPTENSVLPSDIHSLNAKKIPRDVFIPILKIALGNKANHERTNNIILFFNHLYEKKISTVEKGSLLSSIVRLTTIEPALLEGLMDAMLSINADSEQLYKPLTSIFNNLWTLNSLKYLLEVDVLEFFAVLKEKSSDIVVLEQEINKLTFQCIQKILPNEKITIEMFQSLRDGWGGDIAPILILATKLKEVDHCRTLKFLAEMVPHIDPPDYKRWKEWRYNTDNLITKDQIGHLSEEQLKIWKEDYFIESQNFVPIVSDVNKSYDTVAIIKHAINSHHIYNPEKNTSERDRATQEHLGQTEKTILKNPEEKDTVLKKTLDHLIEEMNQIDIFIAGSNLTKFKDFLTALTQKKIPMTSATKNILSSSGSLFSKERSKEIMTNYKKEELLQKSKGINDIERKKIISDDELIKVKNNLKKIETSYNNLMKKRKINIEDTELMYQKRDELKALFDIYRLMDLDADKIENNLISNTDTLTGETIDAVIKNLKGYFRKNESFLADLDKIEKVMQGEHLLKTKKNLVMIVTDNPQMILQVGKYPTGCGSCQNFEGDIARSRSLLGYAGDAHIKAAFLVDLNLVPQERLKEFKELGLGAIQNQLSPQELLNASVARSIIKLTQGTTSLFIEPTYTSQNKRDVSMETYFNLAIDKTLAQPMGVELARGKGDVEVIIPASINPDGQYEDYIATNGGVGLGILHGLYRLKVKLISKRAA